MPDPTVTQLKLMRVSKSGFKESESDYIDLDFNKPPMDGHYRPTYDMLLSKTLDFDSPVIAYGGYRFYNTWHTWQIGIHKKDAKKFIVGDSWFFKWILNDRKHKESEGRW